MKRHLAPLLLKATTANAVTHAAAPVHEAFISAEALRNSLSISRGLAEKEAVLERHYQADPYATAYASALMAGSLPPGPAADEFLQPLRTLVIGGQSLAVWAFKAAEGDQRLSEALNGHFAQHYMQSSVQGALSGQAVTALKAPGAGSWPTDVSLPRAAIPAGSAGAAVRGVTL